MLGDNRQKSAASIVWSNWRRAMEEEEWLDVSWSSQRVAGSHHQLLRKSYWTAFIWKQSLRYYISDAADALYEFDLNTGNIPNELSQLSSLQGLHFNNNNLSGNRFLTAAAYVMAWMQGIFQRSYHFWTTCGGCFSMKIISQVRYSSQLLTQWYECREYSKWDIPVE